MIAGIWLAEEETSVQTPMEVTLWGAWGDAKGFSFVRGTDWRQEWAIYQLRTCSSLWGDCAAQFHRHSIESPVPKGLVLCFLLFWEHSFSFGWKAAYIVPSSLCWSGKKLHQTLFIPKLLINRVFKLSSTQQTYEQFSLSLLTQTRRWTQSHLAAPLPVRVSPCCHGQTVFEVYA